MFKKKKHIATMLIVLTLLLTSFSIMTLAKEPKITEKIYGLKEKEEIKNLNVNDDRDFMKAKENATAFLKNNNLILEKIEEPNIQLIHDNTTNESYYRVRGNGALLDIEKDSGTIKTYIKEIPTISVIDKKYNREMIEEKAKTLPELKNLAPNNKNYNFIEIKEDPNFFPTAWFESKEDNRILFVTFNPENLEILNMGNNKMILSENNEVKIDEETAKDIAAGILARNIKEIEKVELQDVIPNEVFVKPVKGIDYYSKANFKRKAFVVTFNGANKLQVFVDATTGEPIGGDGIL